MENKSIYTDWEQTSINERIKYIVDTFFKGNTTKMAKSVFVSQSTLRDIVGERNSAPSFETMKQIVDSATLRINPVWLLTGQGGVQTGENQSGASSTSTLNRLYPPKPYVENIQASCGTANGFSSAIERNGHRLISLPISADYDFAIEATGLSMVNRKDPERSINPGDLIALKIITAMTYLRWGELYAVATYDDIVVKKIMPSEKEGFIRCVSFNSEDYPDYEMPVSEITGWAAVKAVVSILKF
jgi:phage repressor protein C with HTH and peptisase S24 domain